jgi:hypothetical protein
MDDFFFSLISVWVAMIVLIVLGVFAWVWLRERRPSSRMRLLHSDVQWEFDLRLTYKRFKELYPFSQVTYQEYKRMQMERAFRRAISSEKNKRMVR